MFSENQFIRDSIPNATPEEQFQYRQMYRGLSNKQKKSLDQNHVRLKKKLSFSEWWDYVEFRVKNGHRAHEKNKNNIRRCPLSLKRSEAVYDPKTLKYLGQDMRIV